MKDNVETLSKCMGRIKISGLDPTEAMKIQQHQLIQLCEEIERSANVGIGYAHTIDPILEDIDRLNK